MVGVIVVGLSDLVGLSVGLIDKVGPIVGLNDKVGVVVVAISLGIS
jgi:hypothetical protein